MDGDAESQENIGIIAGLKKLPNVQVGEFQNEFCFTSHAL
jgi:hypothetical protein